MSGKSESSPVPLLKHKCPDCSYATHKQDRLADHLRVHSGERPFACPTCDSTFTHGANRDRHIRRVHLNSEQVACSWSGCGKTFARVASMRLHVAVVHLKTRFSCPVAGCLFTCTRKTQVKKHITVVHKKEKPFACAVAGCSFRCAYQSHLVRHRQSVHEGRRIACSYDGCDYQTSWPQDLDTHVKSVHQKIVRFTCHVCGKGFYRKPVFRGHLQAHARQGHPVAKCASCQEELKKSFAPSSLVSQKEQPSSSGGVSDLLTSVHLDMHLLSLHD